MNCVVCGSNGWLNTELKKHPDKYERWMGITNVRRCWRKCLGCGLWHHRRNYPLTNLEKIYEDGYRHPDFRGENIKEAFERIINIPENENTKRVKWLVNNWDDWPDTLLDIGSGLGVFPYVMNDYTNVRCVESNNDSIKFIRSLGIPCTKDIPDKKFDMISIIHVLEHIEQPIEFLLGLHKHLNDDGQLFIEVPDAIEFERVIPTSDEFNSCHTNFYDVATLCRVLARSVYDVTDIHMEHYKERNLHRIMMICQKGEM